MVGLPYPLPGGVAQRACPVLDTGAGVGSSPVRAARRGRRTKPTPPLRGTPFDKLWTGPATPFMLSLSRAESKGGAKRSRSRLRTGLPRGDTKSDAAGPAEDSAGPVLCQRKRAGTEPAPKLYYRTLIIVKFWRLSSHSSRVLAPAVGKFSTLHEPSKPCRYLFSSLVSKRSRSAVAKSTR